VIRIELAAIGRIGRDLQGCEGVMVARDGTIWAADGRGACTRSLPTARARSASGTSAGSRTASASTPRGRIIVANIVHQL